MSPGNQRAVVAVQEVQGNVRDAVRRALAGAEWTRFVAKGARPATALAEGDTIEVVAPLQGG